MMDRGSIFSPHDAFEQRLINDPEQLTEMVSHLKGLRMKIVLTSGSFDITHIGHMRYLREARMLGDCLVVGIDSDEKIRHSKGEFRPIIPELERAEMVAHSRYADIITIKPLKEERWALIKLVRPDILVVSKRNDNNDENLDALRELCGELVVMESQATTSTSSSVRKLQMETLLPHLSQIRDLADNMISKAKGDSSWKNVVLLYMPVIHRGYMDFLKRNASNWRHCFLLGSSAIRALGPEVEYILKKDMAIRGLHETFVLDFVRTLRLYESVSIVYGQVDESVTNIVMPDEDVTRLAHRIFFPNAEVKIDTIRLRYDRNGIQREDAIPSTECTYDDASRELMGAAVKEASYSKDWWLSVGALIAKEGVPILIAHNEAALDPDLPNIMGDPRSSYARGVNTDDTLVLHAERRLVARAAFLGTSLMGTDAYVTHFPCVPCAESLAEAGIKRLFFKQGYSRLEGAELLLAKGVELFQVV